LVQTDRKSATDHSSLLSFCLLCLPRFVQAREFIARSKPSVITRIVGREILDSRANPTVEADVYALVSARQQPNTDEKQGKQQKHATFHP
jgi:hypothetical protein